LSNVELRDLSKRYPGASCDAVSSVNLTIAEGERFVIVGPSGSGKSTLLRIIAGLETPTSGHILIGGRSMDRVAPRDRGVGMVFQHPALYPHLNARDNLAFGLRARKMPAPEIAERTRELAGWLGLEALLDRRPKELSGGERQRIALGRAVATRPSVLLLDEPFSSLDAPLRASIRTALLDLHRHIGGTMLLVTHDQSEALAVGQRIAVMQSGRIEQIGTPRELYEAPTSRFVAGFLGDPPMSFLRCQISNGRTVIEGGPGLTGKPYGLEGTAWLGLRPEAVHAEIEGFQESFPSPLVGEGRVGGQAVVEAELPPPYPPPQGGRDSWRSGKTEAESRIPAVLDRIEPRGHEAIAWFRIGPWSVASRVGTDFPCLPGQPVTLGLDLDRARWFLDD
jgi:multiple sugar transport system ATP-binding protein